MIETLSPGSSVSADGGLITVAESISQWLWLSLIAVPVVFVFLLVLSVLPFSSRKKSNLTALPAAIVIEILLIATAVAFPFLIGEPKRQNEFVNLPVSSKAGYSEVDSNLRKEAAIVLTLTAENKLYDGRENLITKEELPQKLEKLSEVMTSDMKIVYFKADANASFENAVQVFDRIRKADFDRIGLVVVGAKTEDNPYQTDPMRFEVKLPAPETPEDPIRPNPLTLVAMLEKTGNLTLNREDTGTISDSTKLENKLVEIFKDRERNGVFRVGTNEVEKTVFLKVSKSVKYSDFIKLVEAVKIAGAEPIGIQLDDLE